MQSLSSELARSALDAAPDAMIIIDATGAIRFVNRQVCALFGYSHDEVIGLRVERLMPERFRTRHVAHRDGYAEALRPRAMGEGLALFGRRRDGSEFPVEISLSPIQSGTQALIAAAIRDVSDRKRVDQAIGAMTRLLSALLDISKLESGAIRPELTDFRISTLFEGLRREFASIATSKNLVLQMNSCEETVHSDPALVEQIMKNLLSNAIKYTPSGGRVTLRGLREGNTVRLDVIDTGVGIAPDQLAYIYDEFYQVGVAGNSSREGYGLGLSIVQRLVKLLNLRLQASSEVGKGSVFSLLLVPGRAQRLPEQAQASAVVRSAPAGRPRVLLVEDDAGVRDATRMLLRVEGYKVTAVASLAEALCSAQQEGAPDLLITDYHLGDGELGTQVIAAVRERVHSEVKAVLVTGDTSTAVKHMPDDPRLRVVAKPIEAEQLLRVLDDLLAGPEESAASR